MEWVETTGRSVAEALDAALDQLGVDEQDAEVQILEEPQKGLFGRLRSEARVRARVRPTRPRPKTERRDRRRRGERDRRGRGPAAAGGDGGTKAGGATKVAANRKDEEQPADGASEPTQSEGGNGAASDGGTRKRRRRRGNRSQQQGATVTNVRDESTGTEAAGFDLDAQKDAIEEFLEGLVAALGRPEATVTTEVVEEDTIEAEVNGSELGLLVGPKGQTLQALHELVRSMVQRQFVGQAHARVRLDVGGYRARRREALERFTHKVAEEVVASGEAKRLEPMAASDRKVVHDTANEIAGVKTISEGEEPARRVVIQPE